MRFYQNKKPDSRCPKRGHFFNLIVRLKLPKNYFANLKVLRSLMPLEYPIVKIDNVDSSKVFAL